MKELVAYLARKLFKKRYNVDPGIKVHTLNVADAEGRFRVALEFDISKNGVFAIIDDLVSGKSA